MTILSLAALLLGAAAAAPVGLHAPAPAAPTISLVPALPSFLTGSIFHPDVIAQERQAPATIAFDLDGTLAHMDRGGRFTLRDGVLAQVDQLKAEGWRLALWTAQTRDGVEALDRQHPGVVPRFDRVITGESFIPQSVEGFDDPHFHPAYAGVPRRIVDAFYLIGVSKDLSLFDNREHGRGYAAIVDDNHELEAAAVAAPHGAFSVYRVHTFAGGPDPEPVHRLAASVARLAKAGRGR